jgi:hypothetical protein
VNTGPSGWYRRLAQPRLGYALLVLHTLRSESNNPMESEMPPNRQVFRTVKVGRIDHLYRVVRSVCVDWPQAPPFTVANAMLLCVKPLGAVRKILSQSLY